MTGTPADLSYWLLAQAGRATAVLALAGLAHLALRHRASAATRHFIWTMAMCALLALPVLSTMLPAWHVDVAQGFSPAPIAGFSPAPTAGFGPAHEAGPAAGNATEELSDATAVGRADYLRQGYAGPPKPLAKAEALRYEPTAASVSGTTGVAEGLVILYFAGVALLSARLLRQHLLARRLVASATPVTGSRWRRLLDDCVRQLSIGAPVGLRQSAHSMPMAVGVVRPAIVVPDAADGWDEDRRRAVLLHELAHVCRRDCLTQLLASLACALYWPHPWVWRAARRLRVERELACDDRVLSAGAEPRKYAGHLLEIAYTLGAGRSPLLAVSMARRGQLEGRMLAVLDSDRNRALPGMRARLGAVAVAAALLVPLAAVARGLPAVLPEADLNVTDGTTPRADGDEAGGDRAGAMPRPADAPESGAAAFGTIEQARDEVPPAGAWTLKPSSKPGMVHLEMREERSSSGTTIPLSTFEGLSEAQLTGTGGPVRFTLRRDAGTFTFEGHVRNGIGGGTYSYAANPAFAGELEKRGIGRPTAREQYEMARHDVGLALVDELQSQGYPAATAALLVRAGHHGVRLDFVREMGQLGYKVGSLDALIKMRDHGVTPDYVREMLALGLPKLSADEIVRVRDHGVTPDYVKGLAEAGYTKLSIDELVTTRDHGVTPEYVKRMAALGYAKLPLRDIVKTRNHGVTPEYIEKLAALGHAKLTLDQIVNTRNHGVTPEYIERLAALGYTKLALDQIINTRNHGVTPEYIERLAALGYTKLALDEIINTRNHGVTPEYVEQMKTLGYGSLPLEQLVRARNHGVTPEYISGLKAQGYDKLSLDEVITLRDHGVTPEKVKRANERAGTKLPLDMIRQMADGGGLR